MKGNLIKERKQIKDEMPEQTETGTGDEYELVQSVIESYALDKEITKAWTLADLSIEQENFCRNQTMIASIIREFIKDGGYAEKTYQLLMKEVYLVLILNRNKKSNPLLMGILGKINKTEEKEKEGKFKKLMGKLFPHKNEEKEEEE